ncbi:MAG: hypothetical protein UZ12_BCD005001826 [Bacteroidetes bacterium OLB12]|nr:MAG: hypothetical protein UZ12_BCD005001826 [Bacteroidetes bacterium OLB12]
MDCDAPIHARGFAKGELKVGNSFNGIAERARLLTETES